MGIFDGRIALAPAPAIVRRPRSRSPNGARAWRASTHLAVKQAKRGEVGTGDRPSRCLHNMLRGWMGEGGRIETISATYQQPHIIGSTIAAFGEIVSVTPVVDLWAHDEKQVSGQVKP